MSGNVSLVATPPVPTYDTEIVLVNVIRIRLVVWILLLYAHPRTWKVSQTIELPPAGSGSVSQSTMKPWRLAKPALTPSFKTKAAAEIRGGQVVSQKGLLVGLVMTPADSFTCLLTLTKPTVPTEITATRMLQLTVTFGADADHI